MRFLPSGCRHLRRRALYLSVFSDDFDIPNARGGHCSPNNHLPTTKFDGENYVVVSERDGVVTRRHRLPKRRHHQKTSSPKETASSKNGVVSKRDGIVKNRRRLPKRRRRQKTASLPKESASSKDAVDSQ